MWYRYARQKWSQLQQSQDIGINGPHDEKPSDDPDADFSATQGTTPGIAATDTRLKSTERNPEMMTQEEALGPLQWDAHKNPNSAGPQDNQKSPSLPPEALQAMNSTGPINYYGHHGDIMDGKGHPAVKDGNNGYLNATNITA